MDALDIKFSILCSRCGVQSLVALPLSDLVEALLNGRGVWLQGACGHGWYATPAETERLRHRLDALKIETRRR